MEESSSLEAQDATSDTASDASSRGMDADQLRERAQEEHKQGHPFKAIHTYAKLLEEQLEVLRFEATEELKKSLSEPTVVDDNGNHSGQDPDLEDERASDEDGNGSDKDPNLEDERTSDDDGNNSDKDPNLEDERTSDDDGNDSGQDLDIEDDRASDDDGNNSGKDSDLDDNRTSDDEVYGDGLDREKVSPLQKATALVSRSFQHNLALCQETTTQIAHVVLEEFPMMRPLSWDDSGVALMQSVTETTHWALDLDDMEYVVEVLKEYLDTIESAECEAEKSYRWMGTRMDQDDQISHIDETSPAVQQLAEQLVRYWNVGKDALCSERIIIVQRALEAIADKTEDLLQDKYERHKTTLGAWHRKTIDALFELTWRLGRQPRGDLEVASLLFDAIRTYPVPKDNKDGYGERERCEKRLSSLHTPLKYNFWKDSRVYLQEISGIELKKVDIPDPFVVLGFSWWGSSEGRIPFTDYKFPSTLHYLVEDNDDGSINLTCPYITYAQFQQSRGFLCDYKYTDYIQRLTLLQYQSNIPRNLSGESCKEEPAVQVKKELPRWSPQPPQERHSSLHLDNMFEVYDGFFNNIPGDSTLVDLYNVAGGFDLVSSNWVDWKGFVLYQESNPGLCPRLQGKDGEVIQSRGYISGSWVQGDVSESWITAKIYVVDAVFAVDEKAHHTHNFLFSMDSAGARRKCTCCLRKPC
jgi:hypothetical protein